MIPLTVVGGYLGAGKTTLINRLLAGDHGQRLGLIVNDFGSLGIDAQLLGDAGAADVVDLPNGCVCCTLGTDLMVALQQLGDVSPHLDHVLVELSGVADPATTMAWGTVAPYTPGGAVTAVNAHEVLRQHRDRLVGSEVVRQITAADLLVLTHRDEVDDGVAARVLALLADLAPTTPIVEGSHGLVPHDVLLGPAANGIQPDATTQGDPKRSIDAPEPLAAAHAHAHDDRYRRWHFSTDAPLATATLDALRHLDVPGLLRLKGLLTIDGRPGRTLVQRVGNRTTYSERPASTGPTEVVAIGTTEQFDVAPLTACFATEAAGQTPS